MIEERWDIKSGKRELRLFGLKIGTILIAIAGFYVWRDMEGFEVFLALGTLLVVASVFVPVVLKYVYVSWMAFAAALGWVMIRIIYNLLFYAVFTPIGVVSRMFGKRFLELGWDKSNKSYWNVRKKKHLS